MKTINTLCTLLCVMLLTALPATAQNTTDNKNKAIITTTEGDQELNTDDIQVIRFDGGKITFVQPWGDTTFDRTLRTLSFQRPNPGTLRLTANTSIGSDNSQSGPRRAQGIDGVGNLKSTWENGDVVYVYADENGTTSIGTLRPKTYGEKTATLSGDINADGLSNGQTLYFSTKPRPFDLSTQNGTVESLFYLTATGTLTIDGGNASVSNLSFTRPIAIVKFTLKDKGNSDAAIIAKSFTVYYGTNSYVVTPTTASDELYVGIPAISSQDITLTATDGNEYYLYQKTGVTFEDKKYYVVNVKMQASILARPLTFEAKKANVQVSFTKATDTSLSSLSVEYSTDGATWREYTSGTAIRLTNVGDKVSFRGTNNTYANSTSDGDYSYFSCSDDCYLYGNIMSLINKNSFATTTTLTGYCTFAQLFTGNTNIFNHSTKALVLPATTLYNLCYYGMFNGCTSLTTAPALPATTLAGSCYSQMFQGCTSLKTAPALPATTLATQCYYYMFSGCTSLTTAPALSATTLASQCYYEMFKGCTSLTTAPALPATTLTESCYRGMFQGCTSLQTAPTNLPATTLARYCYQNMFEGCTSLTTVPANLPAMTLAESCYYDMFQGCTSLVTAPALPATELATQCYQYMFKGCTSLTTAPVLPATELASYCYQYMFQGCTSLKTAPALPATTLANFCYSYMFQGCTSLKTAPALPATTLAWSCYQYMFDGCTRLTVAPSLPATTLCYSCYSGMFSGCEKLNSVTCLATNITATDCTTNWLNGVAATGTFYKAPSMTSWRTGASGIPSGWTVIPVGAIPDKFSVSSKKQVYFSQGNLQATTSDNGTSWTWVFATNQWDYSGDANNKVNGNGTVSTNGTVNLFGWVGASSEFTGAAQYGISKSITDSDYGNTVSEALKSDWGTLPISNSGGTANSGWRTLTNDEWKYLFETRTTTSGVLYAKAIVNNVKGVILLPDDWSTSYYTLSNTNHKSADWTSNSITASNWTSKLEAHGAVFLPAAGFRTGSTVSNADPCCYYWSSSSDSKNNSFAFCVQIESSHLYSQNPGFRKNGCSVRLVYDAE